MATIIPEREPLRKAIKWISEKMQEDPCASPLLFINDAILRFDLSPKDGDFLFRFYASNKKEISNG